MTAVKESIGDVISSARSNVHFKLVSKLNRILQVPFSAATSKLARCVYRDSRTSKQEVRTYVTYGEIWGTLEHIPEDIKS